MKRFVYNFCGNMYFLRLAGFNLHVKLELTSSGGETELVCAMILWCTITSLEIKEVNLLIELASHT
jgi:hypothetical protein